ncbi:hypothetical protein Ocin01_19330, partial [Orchesella cincta]
MRDAEQPEENTDAESAVELEIVLTVLQVLTAYPTVKSMSVKLNTPLPSSAPAERLFSYAGMVLRPKRSSLSDELFEQLVPLNLTLNRLINYSEFLCHSNNIRTVKYSHFKLWNGVKLIVNYN